MSKQLGKRAIVGVSSFLVIAAGLASVQSAQAADIPGSTKTQATLKVETANIAYKRGVLERSGDSDWYRVSLTKGKHYYIAVDGPKEYEVAVIIRNRSGKALMRGLDSSFRQEGFEFLAPYTGTYYVDYRVPGGVPATSVPGWYDARVSADCASNATTCVHQVGQTRKSLLGGAMDVDWFKVSLSASKTYTMETVTLKGCGEGLRPAILDSNRRFLTVFGPTVPITGFRPPRDGTYFLSADTFNYCSVLYTLSLTTP